VITTFDYRFFKVYAGFIYLATLAALVLVKVPGIGATDTTGTAQRWFAVAGFQITPSEVAKLSVIVMLAAVLSELRSPGTHPVGPRQGPRRRGRPAGPRVPPAGHRHVDRARGDRRRDARGRGDEAEAPPHADRGRTHLDLPHVPTRA
jgi:Bacterial cell division membrane protein